MLPYATATTPMRWSDTPLFPIGRSVVPWDAESFTGWWRNRLGYVLHLPRIGLIHPWCFIWKESVNWPPMQPLTLTLLAYWPEWQVSKLWPHIVTIGGREWHANSCGTGVGSKVTCGNKRWLWQWGRVTWHVAMCGSSPLVVVVVVGGRWQGHGGNRGRWTS